MEPMTYEEYLEKYIGAEPVPEREFGFYREKAEKLIDDLTFGRSRESDLEEILYAETELIQFLFENGGKRGVISENNDGYSVTYTAAADETAIARDIVKQWLGGTGLMYAGVGPEELSDGSY